MVELCGEGVSEGDRGQCVCVVDVGDVASMGQSGMAVVRVDDNETGGSVGDRSSFVLSFRRLTPSAEDGEPIGTKPSFIDMSTSFSSLSSPLLWPCPGPPEHTLPGGWGKLSRKGAKVTSELLFVDSHDGSVALDGELGPLGTGPGRVRRAPRLVSSLHWDLEDDGGNGGGDEQRCDVDRSIIEASVRCQSSDSRPPLPCPRDNELLRPQLRSFASSMPPKVLILLGALVSRESFISPRGWRTLVVKVAGADCRRGCLRIGSSSLVKKSSGIYGDAGRSWVRSSR